MNVLILTDLEGISRVDSIEMMAKGSPAYAFAQQRLMADINACVDGLKAGGADKVYVVDGHDDGINFIPGSLHKDAVQLSLCEWQDYIKTGRVQALMLIGAHSMPGTFNGFLDHVQYPTSWYNYIVNKRKSGEIAQAAIFAGAYDVPLVMVSGDDAACLEARAFLGNIAVASVKTGIGRNCAICLPEQVALELIRSKACESMSIIDKTLPYKPIMPLEIVLELYRSDMCDDYMEKLGHKVERIDARSIRKIVYSIEAYTDILFRF